MLLVVIFLIFLTGCVSTQEKPAINNNNFIKEFSFIYMGDSQADPDTGDYTAWGRLLQQAANDESQPAFIMIGGDLVNDGNNQDEWDAFFTSGGEALERLKLYPAMGNHDNTDLYKAIFDLPDNGPEGKEEAFYSFDYGDAHFTVMDSNVMGAANQEDIEWLKKDLSQTDKTYKIVMFHHPAYIAVDIPKDAMRAEVIQDAFVPIMEEAGVDLVMSGHQHVYMRTYPLRNGKPNSEGIVYLIGTSGGKQYTPCRYDYMSCSIGGQPVYSIITVNETGILIETRDAAGNVLDSTKEPTLSEEQAALTITVKGDGINEEKELTLGELSAIPNSGFQHVYSTVNTWPTPKFYAAKGIKLHSILEAAGVLDTAQVITFRSPDSYEITFTREQLLEQPRYYYPKVREGIADSAEPVYPIIAYEYKEGSDDMKEIKPDDPCLIIGQTNPLEQTNPAFVVNVSEIIVSNEEAQIWEPAATFPKEGKIAVGESVKLQHKYFGLVKLHYTLDGTDPTEFSQIYNISCYQPELNVPITITDDTVIKVLVTGYGKKNSEITTFTFDAQ
jgi:predicted MPP superfamily phosphohydrolase